MYMKCMCFYIFLCSCYSVYVQDHAFYLQAHPGVNAQIICFGTWHLMLPQTHNALQNKVVIFSLIRQNPLTLNC